VLEPDANEALLVVHPAGGVIVPVVARSSWKTQQTSPGCHPAGSGIDGAVSDAVLA